MIIFNEQTPLKLIQTIQPQIIVKGGDYKKEEVVGYEYEKLGLLEVKIFNYVSNNSTTEIIKRISDR